MSESINPISKMLLNVPNKSLTMSYQFTEQLKDTIAESSWVATALGGTHIGRVHFLLAMLKAAPEDVTVRYLETVKSIDEWKTDLQEIAKENAAIDKKKTTIFDTILPKMPIRALSIEMQNALKNSYLEAKKLGVTEIGVACVCLAMLHEKDFEDKLDYNSMQNFINNAI